MATKTPPKGKGNFLTKKMGPLPAYAWLIIAAGAFYLYYRSKAGSTSSTSSTSTAQQQADQEAEASNEYMSSELASALAGISSEGSGYGYGGGGYGVSPGNGSGVAVSPGNTTTSTSTTTSGLYTGAVSKVASAQQRLELNSLNEQEYIAGPTGTYIPVGGKGQAAIPKGAVTYIAKS